MKHQVHVAIQIVPISKEHPYPIIDKAIAVLESAGVDYRVGAMETVIQGEYDQVMSLVKQMQEICLASGADEIVVNMKVHAANDHDVTWEEKLNKYR